MTQIKTYIAIEQTTARRWIWTEIYNT